MYIWIKSVNPEKYMLFKMNIVLVNLWDNWQTQDYSLLP